MYVPSQVPLFHLYIKCIHLQHLLTNAFVLVCLKLLCTYVPWFLVNFICYRFGYTHFLHVQCSTNSTMPSSNACKGTHMALQCMLIFNVHVVQCIFSVYVCWNSNDAAWSAGRVVHVWQPIIHHTFWHLHNISLILVSPNY